MFHRKSREYVCSICGKDFHKFSSLKNHMKDVHGKIIKKEKNKNAIRS